MDNASIKLKTSPKDFFLHLLSIIALYVAAGSFISLLFSHINVLFADPLEYGYAVTSAYQSIRWAIATLVIVFPVYVWSVWFLNKEYKKEPAKRELWIRRWLVYFTLFAAALFIIGDLVAVIFRFLEGELTARFLFKVLTILIVSGSVFGYYFFDLRNGSVRKKYFAYAAIFIVAVAVVASFFVVRSPQKERLWKFDERRVSDLQSIQWNIVNYWQRKGVLPSALDDLRDDISGLIVPIDPQTSESYEYKAIGNLSFEICAMFSLENINDSSEVAIPRVAAPVPVKGLTVENWAHKAGEVCFKRVIDPDLYPRLKI